MEYLEGKILGFLGSSVTYGFKSDGISFVEFIEERNKSKCYKFAVNGTTLVNNSANSYYSRLKEIDKNIHFDAFIVQVSTNDIYMKYDILEIIKAIKDIKDYISETWAIPVFFYTSPYFDSVDYQKLVNALKDNIESLNIYLIDMYSDEDFNNISEDARKKFMADPVHPTKKGYLYWLTPYIENCLKMYLS